MSGRRGLEHSNPTRRGRVGGEGSTEPNLYFRPFPGENANKSLSLWQMQKSAPSGVGFLFLLGGIFANRSPKIDNVSPSVV
jgi:hypothetical protein